MKRSFVLLFITALLPILALLQPGLPVTHDGQDHVARIANFYESLSEGHLIPRWAANLNWGYGHPILMYLYPLPSYFASFFHFVGFSFLDSTKIVFAVSFLVSILIMYFFVRDAYGEMPALAAALIYGFAPYRFVDMYIRGALGEHVAFVFPPLILWGLFGIAKKRKIRIWGSLTALGVFGLILSHNAISLMVLPIIGLYTLYLWYTLANRSNTFLISACLSLLFGFLWSAFFWIPAFFEGKYTLRDIVTKNEIASRMVPLWSFIYSPWVYGGGDDLTKQLGFPSWIIILLSVGYLFRIRKNSRFIIGALLILLLTTMLLMTSISLPIWDHISLLQKFQFPWRFLTVTTILSSLLAAYLLRLLSHQKQSIILVIICIVTFVTTTGMWRPKANKLYDQVFFTGIYDSTTDTGESSPIWSVRFMESRPPAHVGVVSGQAFIQELRRSTTEHAYLIDASVKTRIVENTLYFPGWHIFVNKKEVLPEFQDPNYRGLMTFMVEPGKNEIQVLFTNTKLRSLSEALSIISLGVGVVLYSVLRKKTI